MAPLDGVALVSPLPPIDLNEAMKDSPRFRLSLLQHSSNLQKLEQRLTEVVKLSSEMNDLGQKYVSAFYKLSVCVNQLSEESFSDCGRAALGRISDAYAHSVHLSKQFYEASSTQLGNKIHSFAKGELSKVSEQRVHFETLSAQMDKALETNAAASKSRPTEAGEGRNALTHVAACFAHTTLDYVALINVANARKNSVIIDALWGLVKEYSSFFSRGHAFFDDWTAEENGFISDSLALLTEAAKTTERKMQDIHSIVNNVCKRNLK